MHPSALNALIIGSHIFGPERCQRFTRQRDRFFNGKIRIELHQRRINIEIFHVALDAQHLFAKLEITMQRRQRSVHALNERSVNGLGHRIFKQCALNGGFISPLAGFHA